jgi:hypothetical protein
VVAQRVVDEVGHQDLDELGVAGCGGGALLAAGLLLRLRDA